MGTLRHACLPAETNVCNSIVDKVSSQTRPTGSSIVSLSKAAADTVRRFRSSTISATRR